MNLIRREACCSFIKVGELLDPLSISVVRKVLTERRITQALVSKRQLETLVRAPLFQEPKQ